jgi:hypothetical protein
MADNVIRTDVIELSFETDTSGLKKASEETDKAKKKVGKEFSDAIDKTTKSTQGLTKSISAIGKSTTGISKLQSDIARGSAAIAAAKSKVDTLTNAIKKTTVAIAKTTVAIAKTSVAIAKIALHPIKSLESLARATKNGFINLAIAIKRITVKPFIMLANGVKSAYASTKQAVTAFKQLAQTKISGVKQNLSDIKNVLTEGEHGAKGLKNALKNIANASVGKAISGITKIKTSLNNAKVSAKTFVSDGISRIKSGFTNAATKVKAFSTSLKRIDLSQLKKLDASISKVTNKLGKGLVSAAKTAARAVSKAMAAVGAISLTGAVTKGVNYNAQMETYQTSFEVMTGSAEKAASVTKKLQEMGAATPFEMTDLADTTQLLMNYGLTADDAIKRMSMLGDISQGDADKLNRVAMAYGQMSSAGKVSLEDVKQMIEFCPAA